MARDIDVSDPKSLSIEDRIYLQDRGILPEGCEPVYGDEMRAYGDGKTVLVATATGTSMVKEKDAASLREPVKATEDEEVDTPYSEWSLADLQAEAKNRGIPAGGTKTDLATRLEKDDE